MKKNIIFLILGLLILSSCTQDIEIGAGDISIDSVKDKTFDDGTKIMVKSSKEMNIKSETLELNITSDVDILELSDKTKKDSVKGFEWGYSSSGNSTLNFNVPIGIFFNQICPLHNYPNVTCVYIEPTFENISRKSAKTIWNKTSSLYLLDDYTAINTWSGFQDPYLTSAVTSQWGGVIPNKSSTILFFDFQGDCNDESGNNYDCSLKTGASIIDNKLYLNRTKDVSARAEVFEQGLSHGSNFCYIIDFDNYDYSSGRFFYYQDDDQFDNKPESGHWRIVVKDALNNYDTYTGTASLGSYTSKWSYFISIDSTNSKIVTWYNGTVDINTSFDTIKDTTEITLQIPRNTLSGQGYIDNFILYNETCNQDDIDSWMNIGSGEVIAAVGSAVTTIQNHILENWWSE